MSTYDIVILTSKLREILIHLLKKAGGRSWHTVVTYLIYIF